jgi:hypothetical protein
MEDPVDPATAKLLADEQKKQGQEKREPSTHPSVPIDTSVFFANQPARGFSADGIYYGEGEGDYELYDVDDEDDDDEGYYEYETELLHEQGM